MIRRTRSHTRQVVLTFVFGLLLLGFAVSQTIPFAHTSVELASPRSDEDVSPKPSSAGSLTITPSPEPSLTPAPSPTGTPPPIVRDLSQYEYAGSISMGTAPAERQAALSQMRTFLLRKWGARALGRVSLISTTPAGRPMTGNFFVERDAGGQWCVTLETGAARPPEVFYFVEEVGVAGDGRPILEPRAGDPQPVSHALHLKRNAAANSGLVL